MKSPLFRLIAFVKKSIWAVIVAYMLGVHNFYKGDDKTTDNIGGKTEVNEAQEDGAPRN